MTSIAFSHTWLSKKTQRGIKISVQLWLLGVRTGLERVDQSFSPFVDSRHPSLDSRHASMLFVIWAAPHFNNKFIYYSACLLVERLGSRDGETAGRESLSLPLRAYLFTLPEAPFKGSWSTPECPGTLVENHWCRLGPAHLNFSASLGWSP